MKDAQQVIVTGEIYDFEYTPRLQISSPLFRSRCSAPMNGLG
jgi:hypothetical protein